MYYVDLLLFGIKGEKKIHKIRFNMVKYILASARLANYGKTMM